MIESWIKITRSLLDNPKVDVMLASLSQRRNVTSRVTSRDTVIVTLIRLFLLLNDHADGELVRNADDQWVDRNTTEGFAVALQKVGWMEVLEEGVRFPNFLEHNKPRKGREGRTNAQRQKEYRERKKNKTAVPSVTESDVAVTSRVTHNAAVTVTPRREEESIVLERDNAGAGAKAEVGQVEQIVNAYTLRDDDFMPCREVVAQKIAAGEDPQVMLANTREIVQICLATAPGGKANAMLPWRLKFFQSDQWKTPDAFRQRWKPRNGKSTVALAMQLPLNGSGSQTTSTPKTDSGF
jgi:hypothetical protein